MEAEEIIRKDLIALYKEYNGMPPDKPIIELKTSAFREYKLLPEQWQKLLKEVIKSEHLWSKKEPVTDNPNDESNDNNQTPIIRQKPDKLSATNQYTDSTRPVSAVDAPQTANWDNNYTYIYVRGIAVNAPQTANWDNNYTDSKTADISNPAPQTQHHKQEYIHSTTNNKKYITDYTAIISAIGLLFIFSMVYIIIISTENNNKSADTNKKTALIKQKLQPERDYMCWRKDNKVYYHFYIQQNEDKLRYRYRISNHKIDSIGYFTIDTLNLSINVDRWEEDMKLNIEKNKCYLKNKDWSIDLGEI